MPVIHAAQPPAIDRQKRLTQHISIVLSTILFAALAAYPIYSILQSVTKTVIIQQPSLTTYSAMYSAQMDALTCTCSNPSINYDNFINIQYVLHQICSSDFVTPGWIYQLATPSGPIFQRDFRLTSSSTFQALGMFCDLVSTAINESLLQFYSNSYISVYITPLATFELQTQAWINRFISSATNSFLLSLSMIRGTIQSNALSSGLQTNYMQMVYNNSQVFSLPQIYDNCDCTTSAMCTMQSSIYNYPNPTVVFNVSGFYTGCYIIESLLQSDLRCLFNQTCLNSLRNYLNSSTSMPVIALDSLIPSRYSQTSSIQELISNLMVEQWNSSMSYSAYYVACKPMQCSYNIMARNDTMYLITILIGLIGGLIAILNFIVPRVVKFFVYLGLKSEPAVVRTLTVVSRK